MALLNCGNSREPSGLGCLEFPEFKRATGVFGGHAKVVWHVACSARAKLAATCGYLERSILLWNLETGKEVRRIDANDTAAVADICFSPDGKLLARAGVDQVDLWDVASGQEV